MNTTPSNLAMRIRAQSLIHGNFVLRSGKTSDIYFDKYRFESDPALLLDIASEMAALVPPDCEVLAGLEMGGIPVVTMLSQVTRLPAAFVRKEPKEYGTCRYIEGADLKGKNFVIIEDVVSSGGAIIDSVQKMREDGFAVSRALCVIDRESGGRENLAQAGIDLTALFRYSDIMGSE